MYRILYNGASQLHHYYLSSTDLKATIHALGFLLNPHNTHSRSVSTPPSSSTLDFLVNSCGLDPKVKKLTLKTTDKPDLVLEVLRKYGISDTQIKQIVSKTPKILKCHPQKTLDPKIQFLHSLGFSGSDIAEVLNHAHGALFIRLSLENKIVPCVNFLKSYVGSKEALLQAMKTSSRYFSARFEGLVVQNSKTLREYGVEEHNILQIFIYFPTSLLVPNDQFKEIVEEVKEMGFDPSNTLFGHAVRTIAMNESKWKEKWEAYRNLGFSDEEITAVFRKHPFCLTSSVEKIRRGVNLFTQKMKWSLADICVCPSLLRLSLENRIIPRYNVLELLNSKGVIHKKLDVHSLARVFLSSEKDFLLKFVVQYLEAVPEVVNLYKVRIDLANMQEDDGAKKLN